MQEGVLIIMQSNPLTRIQSQIAQFHSARRDCQRWANASGRRKFVVRNQDRYYLADLSDLRCYHRRDIHARRAELVYIGKPIFFTDPPGSNPEDDSEGDRTPPDRP